jgi:hypothetical protein
LIAGLSSSASAGPIGCTSGLDAFELGALDLGVLVGFLGASGFFAMAANIGTNPPLGSDLIRFLIALLTGSGQSRRVAAEPTIRPVIDDVPRPSAQASARRHGRTLDDIQMDAVAAVTLQRPVLRRLPAAEDAEHRQASPAFRTVRTHRRLRRRMMPRLKLRHV